MKRLLIILFGLFASYQAHTQNDKYLSFDISAGSAWIAMPQTFISDSSGFSQDTYLLTNAENGFTAQLSITYSKNIRSKKYQFRPGVSLSYVSGGIKLTRVNNVNQTESISVKGQQRYFRLQIPLIFEARTEDGFSLSFGPMPFVNFINNKILEDLSDTVAPDATVDSSYPIGLGFRIGVGNIIAQRYKAFLKWDFDMGRRNFLQYSEPTYQAKFYTQSITVGFGYLFLK